MYQARVASMANNLFVTGNEALLRAVANSNHFEKIECNECQRPVVSVISRFN